MSEIVTIGIATRKEVTLRAIKAIKDRKKAGNFISFETPELLFKTLTQKRWDILRAMTGKGPMSIREAARQVGRDVKAVHGDVTELLNSGLLEKADNKIVFPYDQVHVDFVLSDTA